VSAPLYLTDRQRLRAALLCFAGALGLLLYGAVVGHCEEITVSAGATTSAGLGEQPVSPLFRVRAITGRMEATGSFDWSRKSESGAGWIGGLDVDTRLGWLIVGADYRHRDGGLWAKDVAFAHVGVQARPARLMYRHEVYSTSVPANRARFLELSARHGFGSGGFFVEGLIAGALYLRQDGTQGRGMYSQVSLGRAWRGNSPSVRSRR
jgi:hypothetical protein